MDCRGDRRSPSAVERLWSFARRATAGRPYLSSAGGLDAAVPGSLRRPQAAPPREDGGPRGGPLLLGARGRAQQRLALRLPAEQRPLLPDRLRGARVGPAPA